MSKMLRLSEEQLLARIHARVRGPAAADVAAGQAPRVSGTARSAAKGRSAADGNEAAARRPVSGLEESLALQMRMTGITEPVREYRFIPERRWRADFAWPDRCLLVEVEGGHFTNGRHTRGKGFEADCEKYAEAALAGWRVIRVTGTHIKSGDALEWIRRALA